MDHQYQEEAGHAHYDARFNEKGCLLVWGGDALRSLAFCSFQVLYSSSPKSHW